MQNNWYVYRHLKPCGEVFYIGISKNKRRANDCYKRNCFWKSVFERHGREVQILTKNLSKEGAIELETLLIAWYGRRDLGTGSLVNMTSGGDGMSLPSPEQRQRMSETTKRLYREGVYKNSKGGFLAGKLHVLYGQPRSEDNKNYMSTLMKEKYSNGKHPLIGVKRPDVAMRRGAKNSASKKVIDTQTKIIYSCLREAAEVLGMCFRTLGEQLRGKLRRTTYMLYLEDYVEGVVVEPDPTARKHSVKVIDTATNIIYPSISEAAKSMGYNAGTLQDRLRGKIVNNTTLEIYNEQLPQ